MFEMTYYVPNSVMDPYSKEASSLCQEIADKAKTCGYPDCDGTVVGCATHESMLKEGNKYIDSAKFVAVCQKHKEWEHEKVTVAC